MLIGTNFLKNLNDIFRLIDTCFAQQVDRIFMIPEMLNRNK